MALKNWKKIFEGKSEWGVDTTDVWENKNSKARILIVNFKEEERKWFVTSPDPEPPKFKAKSFKTKSQALGYAKNYMRNH